MAGDGEGEGDGDGDGDGNEVEAGITDWPTLFPANLPLTKKYPTAKAAKTRPIVIILSQGELSMGRFYHKST